MVYSKLLGYHLTFIQIMSQISIRDHKGVGMEWQDLENNPEGKASYGGAGSKKLMFKFILRELSEKINYTLDS